MKLKATNYAIDIKVQNVNFSGRCNLMDTISFLNMASIAFQKAADYYKAYGKEFIACDFEKISDDIYAALKAAGAYKDI